MNSSNFIVRHYILSETFIAIIPNIGIALFFAILSFHGQAQIQVFGKHGLVLDAIPQTFMGVFMTVLAVLLVTGSRLRQGKFGPAWSSHPFLRVFGIAISMAIVTTCICLGLLALILPKACVNGMGYETMLVFKCIYSAVLAMIITPLALLTVFRGSAEI